MNKPIVLFLALAFGITWGIDAVIFKTDISPAVLVPMAMWGPGLAAIITQAVFYRQPLPGLKPGKKQYLLAGYLLPLLYAVPVYLFIWTLGFAPFNTSFSCSYLAFFTLGQLQQILAAGGEELGWRGFLYPQWQKQYGSFTAAFLTGIIWAVWHFPLIIGGYHGGVPLWFKLSCFSLMIVSVSFIAAWLRDRSGSIWPAILLHASHNFYIQVFLNNLTSPSAQRAFVYSEEGLGLALASFVVASMLWIKHYKTSRPTLQFSV